MSLELATQPAQPNSDLLVLSTTQTSTLTRQLIARLPGMSDEELLQCAQFAEDLGKSAYLIRGAVGAEIRKRYPTLSGRARDVEEAGRKARLTQLAAQHGLSLRAIEDDAAIYATFVEEAPRENSDVDITVLPLEREYYRLALQTQNPQASIKEALREKEEDAGYSTRDFRAYVKRLRQGERQRQEPARPQESEPFQMQVDGASVLVQTGKENSLEPVLSVLKKAVRQVQEELKHQQGEH